MPELPEVETVVRHLRPFVEGRVIARVSTPKDSRRSITGRSPEQLTRALAGARVLRLTRRAKYIVFELEQGCLTVHLRMTGRLILEPLDPTDRPYIRATLHFRGGQRLHFKDVRRFGRIQFFSDFSELDCGLGIEPLSQEFTAARLHELLKHSSRMLKPLLLDQSQVAGLGNIYVDESLWAAQLHPCANSSTVTKRQAQRLHRAIRSILRRSIELNGTTFQSFSYGDDRSGEFHDELSVFDRTGEKCPRCRAQILKIRVAQRGTHYCPGCQRV